MQSGPARRGDARDGEHAPSACVVGPARRPRRRGAAARRDVDPFVGTSGVGHTVPGAKAPLAHDLPHAAEQRLAGVVVHRRGTSTVTARCADARTRRPAARASASGSTGVVRPAPAALRIVSETAAPGYYAAHTESVSVELTAAASLRRAQVHFNDSATPPRLHFVDAELAVAGTDPCVVRLRRTARSAWAVYDIFLHGVGRRRVRAARPLGPRRPRGAVRPHVALSYVDAAGAEANFRRESAPFERVRLAAARAWSARLARAYAALRVPPSQGRVFDTALYHMMVAPYVHSDADGRYAGADGVRRRGNATLYTFLSTWDTYRVGAADVRIAPT